MWKKQRQKTNEYDCSNVAKFDAEKLTQLKNMFNKNAYATTNEYMKFKFSKHSTYRKHRTFK